MLEVKVTKRLVLLAHLYIYDHRIFDFVTMICVNLNPELVHIICRFVGTRQFESSDIDVSQVTHVVVNI